MHKKERKVRKLGRVSQSFLDEYSKMNVSIMDDRELHKLLVKAVKEKDREARNKVFLHILPVIINRCKKFFRENYIVETMDFIQEVSLLILDKCFENFRIDEQEEGRCALFFKAFQFYFLCALSNLKRNYLKRDKLEVDYKEIRNYLEKELLVVCPLDFNKLIEEDLEEVDYEEYEFVPSFTYSQNLEENLFKQEVIDIILSNFYLEFGISLSIVLNLYEGLLKDKSLLDKLNKTIFKVVESKKEKILEVLER